MKRIALVRLTALGDVIHTAASLQFIKAALPDAHISWFVEEKFAEILAHNPQIDRIVPLDLHSLKKERSLSKIISLRRRIEAAGPFDLVIDVQGLIKSALVARFAGKRVAGLDRHSAREGIASILYSRRYPVDCADIAPMRFARLIAQALEIDIGREMMERKAPYLFCDPERDRAKIEAFFDSRRPNVLLVTAASLASKTYPAARWIDVVRGLEECNVLLVAGSTDERRTAKRIAAESSARLLPPMDLDTLKYSVGRCDLLLGGDTGPSHIAWAMNRPSILLFGATPTAMMMQTPINLALSSGVEVHPCRFDKSDRSIASIAPERIIRSARSLLEK